MWKSFAIKVSPKDIQQYNGQWYLTIPASQNGNAMFVIEADWCGHCQRLGKTLYDAGRIIQFPVYNLEAIDDPDTTSKLSEMKVKGFPTVFLVQRGGLLVEYRGGRSLGEICNVLSCQQ